MRAPRSARRPSEYARAPPHAELDDIKRGRRHRPLPARPGRWQQQGARERALGLRAGQPGRNGGRERVAHRDRRNERQHRDRGDADERVGRSRPLAGARRSPQSARYDRARSPLAERVQRLRRHARRRSTFRCVHPALVSRAFDTSVEIERTPGGTLVV